jgi:uncharacterized protein YuzE
VDIACSKNGIHCPRGNQESENMALNMIEEKNIDHLLKATTHLVHLPQKHMWLDYDSDADVLYVHFEEKPSSNHSEMRQDGIILDYADKDLVGLTILEASQR